MRKKQPFTLIEILFALGVIAIGVCSVMVLFPVGASATRDAAMETYAAHAAESLLHYYKYRLVVQKEAFNALTPAIPASEPADYGTADEEELSKTATWTQLTDFKGYLYSHDSRQGIFQIIAHHAGFSGNDQVDILNAASGDDKIDFRGIAKVWYQEITKDGTNKYQFSRNGAAGSQEMDTASTDYNGQTAACGTLMVEVSWPAELPAAARQKAVYSLDVAKLPSP